MKLIIDINENVYKAMKTTYLNSYPQFDGYDMCVMSKKVREGTPLQAELEKIKAELQNEKDKSNNTYYAMKSVGLSTAIKIIDKHIAELKGENNDR